MADDSLYRRLCEHVGFALIAADADFVIQAWNPAAARLFDAPAERMVGSSLLGLIPAEEQSAARTLLRRALQRGESSEFEIPYVNAAGRRLVLAVTVSPLLDDSGDRVGICAGVRDITRRVALEKQIAANRTMAALGRICGGVAHHFNNLLGGIATSVDFALTTSDLGAMRRALRLTADSVARAAKITQSLLTFAEGDPSDDRYLSLDEVVRRFAEEERPRIEGRNVRFLVEVQPIPALSVPARHVRTMLQHLAANALEAMPMGGELRVWLFADPRGVHLIFADTGIGIATKDLDRIFEPFFTTRDEARGGAHVGLGLAVVHGVVRELGGTITAQSEPGQGTRLEILLPPKEPP